MVTGFTGGNSFLQQAKVNYKNKLCNMFYVRRAPKFMQHDFYKKNQKFCTFNLVYAWAKRYAKGGGGGIVQLNHPRTMSRGKYIFNIQG